MEDFGSCCFGHFCQNIVTVAAITTSIMATATTGMKSHFCQTIRFQRYLMQCFRSCCSEFRALWMTRLKRSRNAEKENFFFVLLAFLVEAFFREQQANSNYAYRYCSYSE
jgi:hypothetical protein